MSEAWGVVSVGAMEGSQKAEVAREHGVACPRVYMNRTVFGSASFRTMDYAPSISAGVPAARAQDYRGVDA